MQKNLCMLLIFFCLSTANPFHVDNIGWKHVNKSRVQHDVPIRDFFKEKQPCFNDTLIVTDPPHLMQAAKDVIRCLKLRQKNNDAMIDPAGFGSLISLDRVIKTLEFVVKIIEQDLATKKFRILDPLFLENNFSCIGWNADTKSAKDHGITLPNDGRIRLTLYGIWTVHGSEKKTGQHCCGLYKLLDDALGKKYTKHQILAGALERPENHAKCKALAWVERQDLEDALMQGTVVVKFPNGSYKILNVHKTNGIAYDRHKKDMLAQERYWFFKEIAPDAGSKKRIIERFKRRKEVIFAGDLHHIGLGKLVAIKHINPTTKKCELRLGILADTGGAFDNNLYQLDLFGGFFESKQALKKYLGTLPSATQACILYRT